MAKGYQGCNQNLYIIEEQTQWPKDTKGGNENLYIIEEQTYTDSDYTLGILWPLCFLFFYDIQILITTLGIFWPLCLFFYDIQILSTP